MTHYNYTPSYIRWTYPRTRSVPDPRSEFFLSPAHTHTAAYPRPERRTVAATPTLYHHPPRHRPPALRRSTTKPPLTAADVLASTAPDLVGGPRPRIRHMIPLRAPTAGEEAVAA
jgi:hypothetical protein